MATANGERFDLQVRHTLVGNSSTAPPAVRMVVAWCWEYEGEARLTLFPVLALWTRRESFFVRHFATKDSYALGLHPSDSRRDYQRRGFRPDGVRDHTSCLILHDNAVVAHDDPELELGIDGMEIKVFVCSWPQEKDVSRLQEELDAMLQQCKTVWKFHRLNA